MEKETSSYLMELKEGISMESAKEELVGKLTLTELIINELKRPIGNEKNKYKKFLSRFSQTKSRNVEVIYHYISYIDIEIELLFKTTESIPPISHNKQNRQSKFKNNDKPNETSIHPTSILFI